MFAKLHAQKAQRYSLAIAAGFIASEPLGAVLVPALIAAALLQAS